MSATAPRPPGWLTLPSGLLVWLPEGRPCSCGNRVKLVARASVYCARCVRPRDAGPVVGWIDCVKKTFHEGRPT